MTGDTIAAIATAMSASGIGIIRISGDDSMEIISKVYRSKGGKKQIKEAESHTIHYGFIYDNDTMIDEVLVMIMKENYKEKQLKKELKGNWLIFGKRGKKNIFLSF